MTIYIYIFLYRFTLVSYWEVSHKFAFPVCFTYMNVFLSLLDCSSAEDRYYYCICVLGGICWKMMLNLTWKTKLSVGLSSGN